MIICNSCTPSIMQTARQVVGRPTAGTVLWGMKHGLLLMMPGLGLGCWNNVRHFQTTCRISAPGISSTAKDKASSNFLRDKKTIPDSDPPSTKDINLLYELFEQRKKELFLESSQSPGWVKWDAIPRPWPHFPKLEHRKLMVLTGAGISTESGIPDYRSPNGAYSTGFKPITHQEFVRSIRARRRYWARSFAGWRRFTAAQPGPGHTSLASLERIGRVNFMITQNVDRLHHRAGSNPLELHGTVYTVVCLDCGSSLCRNVFQDQVKELNPKWAAAIENLNIGSSSPGSDRSFGMKQRPDGDVEIDEKFWEEDFHIPTCQQCSGVLKPDVVLFGDNVPKNRADKAMEAARGCDAFLVLGSSLMTMSAFRLVRAAYEAGASIAIVNIGVTRADSFVPLKISARCGEILPRLLNVGSLAVPSLH